MQSDAPLKIFIIYAHEDRGFKEDLLKRLKLLRSQGLIAPWHDRDLIAGDDWDKVIRGHLAVADIILPIISIDFFNSDYIEQVEIVEAFERYEQGKAHIIPIIARQCRWEDDRRIAKLQALPENGLPIAKWFSIDDAFDSVYDGIKAKVLDILNKSAQADLQGIKAKQEASNREEFGMSSLKILELKIPNLGEYISSTTFAKWLRPNGSSVVLNEPICEIETEKANVELLAESAGKLIWIVAEGEDLPIGAVFAKIETEAGG